MPDKIATVTRVKLLETAQSLHDEILRLLNVVKLMKDEEIESMPMIWSTNTQTSVENVESMVAKAHIAFKIAKRAKDSGEPSKYDLQLEKSEKERKRKEKIARSAKKKGAD